MNGGDRVVVEEEGNSLMPPSGRAEHWQSVVPRTAPGSQQSSTVRRDAFQAQMVNMHFFI